MADNPIHLHRENKLTRRDFVRGAIGVAALAASAELPGCEVYHPMLPPNVSLFQSNWFLHSSNELTVGGEELSQPGGSMNDWIPVTLPSTVLAALVADGQYPDLFESDNLKHIPVAQFRVPWWYRKVFTARTARLAGGRQVWLHFKGINYRANIWLNGKQIAAADTVAGAYRDFEFNITSAVRDGTNALAVEVFPPKKQDLSITFVDWAPTPPDQNMGIWQDVQLHVSGPVAIRNPHVSAEPELPALNRAAVTIMADLVNASDQVVTGKLSGFIHNINRGMEQNVSLQPGETRTVCFQPLTIDQPRIWWPWQLGSPELYELSLAFQTIDSSTQAYTHSDQCGLRFGIRKITSRLQNGNVLFTVNGVDLLILGGGYAPDLLQRRVMPNRRTWQEDHIRYVRDMNLNTIRLEGKLEDDAFFDLCDRHGILVMAGWCCCSAWERWKDWKAEEHSIATESLKTQIRKLRTHPSLLVWLNGSDNPPPADVERAYLAVESDLKWPNPTLSSASATETTVTGVSGVKMNGPYKWEPPIFWTTDTQTGGAWGFNTEVGPGAVPPPLETLKKILPPEHRWPIDSVWNFHCGKGDFAKLDDFNNALDARYGKATGIADYAWKSQAQAYETIRAMYESFRANKFHATGEIQWMLNNAWPSMIWHLYDYYFRPGGAYFATKVACRPLHILYRYDNQQIVIANDTTQSQDGLIAKAEIYDQSARLWFEQHRTCSSSANSATTAFALPSDLMSPKNYFLRLTLTDATGAQISVNSYWLSATTDVLDWDKSDWNHTPCKSFADFTALQDLPKVDLQLDSIVFPTGNASGESSAQVGVTNASKSPAMMVRLKITRGPGGEELLPIRWEDNYFLLLPGERREITARWMTADLQGRTPAVSADCYNNRNA